MMNQGFVPSYIIPDVAERIVFNNTFPRRHVSMSNDEN